MKQERKNDSGFTLAEVVAVTAIIAVLGTVATVSVSTYLKHDAAIRRDTLAEQAYNALQDKLNMERVKGKLDEYTVTLNASKLTETAVDSILDTNFSILDAGSMTEAEYINSFHAAHGTDSLYYLTLDGADKDNALVSYLFDALGDSGVYGMDYVVEFNADTGRVMSVFCSDETELSYSTNLIDRDSAVLGAEKIGYHGIYWTADNAPFTEGLYFASDKGVMTNGVFVPDGSYAADGSTVFSELTFYCEDRMFEKYPFTEWMYTVTVGDGSGNGFTSEKKAFSQDTTADMNSLYESVSASVGGDKASRYLYMYLEQNGYKAGYYDTDAQTADGEPCKLRHLLFLLDNPVTDDSWGKELNTGGVYGNGEYYCSFTVSYGDNFILNYDCDDIGSGTKLFNPLFDHYDSATDTYYITSPRHLSNMRYGKPDGKYVIDSALDFTDVERTATYLAKDTEIIASLPAGSGLTAGAVSAEFTPLSWKDASGNSLYFSGSLSAGADEATAEPYHIKGMKITETGNSYVALIPYLVSGAEIHDLYFEDCSVEAGGSYAAIVCGQGVSSSMENITFKDCTVKAKDHSAMLAGIVKGNSSVAGITSEGGSVTGTSYTAGFIGEYVPQKTASDVLTISDIHNGTYSDEADVKGASISGTDHAAGVIGKVTGKMNAENLVNNGEVQGSTFVSGIIGQFDGTSGDETYLKKADNHGNITGNASYVAGVVACVDGKDKKINVTITALSNDGIISNTGDYTGGIIGSSSYANIGTLKDGYEGCSNTGNVTGHDYTGGISGYMKGYYYTWLWKKTDYYAHVRELSSTGVVSGNNYVGGLSGYAYELYVEGNADATGDVSGNSNKMRCLGWHERVIPNNTLPAANTNIDEDSVWLSDGIKRNQIESVTVTAEHGGHYSGDGDCTAISTDGYGNCIVHYEDTDNNGLYEAYIYGYSYEWAPLELTNGDAYFASMQNLLSCKIEIPVVVNSSSGFMFGGCAALTNIDVSKLDTSKVTDMDSMFYGCAALTNIDVGKWDTSSVTNMASMFYGCAALTNIDVSKWDTSSVTSMDSMFYGCAALTNIDVGNWNTSSVTNMDSMFDDCAALTNIDAGNWNTSSVTSMYGMFYGCAALTNIDVGNWNTSSVTNMASMFYGCAALTNIDVGNWNTSSVTRMDNMFNSCAALINIDVSNWDTSSVTSMDWMFEGCAALANIDVGNWNVSKVTGTNGMFAGCAALTNIDVGSWNVSKVTGMSRMFEGCVALTNIDVSKWDVSKVTTMSSMFEGCAALTNIDVGNWDTSKVTGVYHMFYGCVALTNIDVSKWDVSKVNNIRGIFSNCTGLISLDLSDWNTSSVLSFEDYSKHTYNGQSYYVAQGPFSNCTSLEYLSFRNWNMTNFNSFVDAVNGAQNVKEVDFRGVSLPDPDKGNRASDSKGYPFYNVYATFFGSNAVLEKIWLPDVSYDYVLPRQQLGDTWYGYDADGNYLGTKYTVLPSAHSDASGKLAYISVEKPSATLAEYGDLTYLFGKQDKAFKRDAIESIAFDISGTNDNATGALASADVSKGQTNSITMYAKDSDGNGLYEIVIDSKGLPIIVSQGASYLFYGCNKLTALDVSDLDMSKVTDMRWMFFNCTALTNIDVSNLDTSSATTMGDMFSGCAALTNIDVSKWDTSSVKILNGMFDGCAALTNIDVGNWDTSKVTEMSYMFRGCAALTNIDVSNWDVSSVTTMSWMFYGCAALTNIDVSNWDTSSVIALSGMFEGCAALTNIDVGKWDASSVRSMNEMFYGCAALTNIDVSNWDTSSVTNMSYMFYNCAALTNIDVSKWSTSKVTGMSYMFRGCAALANIDVGNWDVSKVTNMYGMFYKCAALANIDVSNWDVSKVTDMRRMFENCSSLKILDMSDWDTSSVQKFESYHYKISSGKNYYVAEGPFDGCTSLEYISFRNWNMTNFNSFVRTLRGTPSVKEIDFRGVSLPDPEKGNRASDSEGYPFADIYTTFFDRNEALEKIWLPDVSYDYVLPRQTSGYCWYGYDADGNCLGTTYSKLPAAGSDPSGKLAYISAKRSRAVLTTSSKRPGYFFDYKGADDSYFNKYNAESFEVYPNASLFDSQGVLAQTDVSADKSGSIMMYCKDTDGNGKYEISIVSVYGIQIYMNKDSSYLFGGNQVSLYSGPKLVKISGLEYLDASEVVDMSYMFRTCSLLSGKVDLSNWDTSNVTNMKGMFYFCPKIESVSLANCNMRNVTDMGYMFLSCSDMTVLDLTGCDLSGVSSYNGYANIFKNCSALSKIYLPGKVNGTYVASLVLPDGTWYGYSSDDVYLESTYVRLPASKSDAGGKLTYISLTPLMYLGTYGNVTYLFGKDDPTFSRDVVESISFVVDKTYSGTSALASADVSDLQNGKIMMYSYDTDADGLYEIKIVSDEIIKFNPDSSYLFSAYNGKTSRLEQISGMENLDTCSVTNISRMFEGCATLTNIDVGNWNTSKVTDMSYMFKGCAALTNIDVGNWNTSKVTSMYQMFKDCAALTNIDVSSWNTSKVTGMSYMFSGCAALTNIDVSKWNTYWAVDRSSMFEGCVALTNIDVSNWDTSKVTNMRSMFSGCAALTNIDVGNWDTSKVTDISWMFKGCVALTNIDVSNWDVSKVADMSYMFDGCIALTNIDVSNWNTSSVTNMSYMFEDCVALTNIDVSNWNTSSVTNMSYMFDGCVALTNIDVSNWDVSIVTNMHGMFFKCAALTNIDVSNWNTSSVTNMGYMFFNCATLTSIDLSNWDTSSVTRMADMFYGCAALTNIDVSNWDTSSVTGMEDMFEGCAALTNIGVSNWDTSNVTNMKSMFEDCATLTSIDLSNWDTSRVTRMSYMFEGCAALTSIDLSNWDTSRVTDMHSMFYKCAALTNIDVSNWNTSRVTDMSSMFEGCVSLTSIDLSNWDTSRVTDMSWMFAHDKNLKCIYVGDKWVIGSSTKVDVMFSGCGVTSVTKKAA